MIWNRNVYSTVLSRWKCGYAVLRGTLVLYGFMKYIEKLNYNLNVYFYEFQSLFFVIVRNILMYPCSLSNPYCIDWAFVMIVLVSMNTLKFHSNQNHLKSVSFYLKSINPFTNNLLTPFQFHKAFKIQFRKDSFCLKIKITKKKRTFRIDFFSGFVCVKIKFPRLCNFKV